MPAASKKEETKLHPGIVRKYGDPETGEVGEIVRVTKRVDARTVHRSLVRYTPAHCRECGFCVVQGEDAPDYEDMDLQDRNEIKRAVKRHVQKVHNGSVNDSAMVTPESISTHWHQKPMPI